MPVCLTMGGASFLWALMKELSFTHNTVWDSRQCNCCNSLCREAAFSPMLANRRDGFHMPAEILVALLLLSCLELSGVEVCHYNHSPREHKCVSFPQLHYLQERSLVSISSEMWVWLRSYSSIFWGSIQSCSHYISKYGAFLFHSMHLRTHLYH